MSRNLSDTSPSLLHAVERALDVRPATQNELESDLAEYGRSSGTRPHTFVTAADRIRARITDLRVFWELCDKSRGAMVTPDYARDVDEIRNLYRTEIGRPPTIEWNCDENRAVKDVALDALDKLDQSLDQVPPPREPPPAVLQPAPMMPPPPSAPPPTVNRVGQIPKRSTERGEGRAKLIAALTKHHQYADGGCLNLEPIGNNKLGKAAGVSPSTASVFFKNNFQGHTKYKALCRDAGTVTAALKLLNDEFAPYRLLGAASSDLTAPEEEDIDEE